MTKQDYIEWQLELQRLTAEQNLAAHIAVHHLLAAHLLADDVDPANVDLAMRRAQQFAELGRQIDAHIKAYKHRGGSDD